MLNYNWNIKQPRTITLLLVILLSYNSCRTVYDEGFEDLEIINNAPVAGEIDTVAVAVGGSVEINLSAYFFDKESETIIYEVETVDESVAIITGQDGSVTTISGITLGSTEARVFATDGNEGNEVTTSFVIEVLESVGPSAVLIIDFSGEVDGTEVENMTTLPDGVNISLAFDGDGPSGAIQSGALNMDLNGTVTDEGLTVGGLSIELATPIDLSESPFITFEYANAFSSGNPEEGDAFMAVGDASDNGAFGAIPFVLPEFVLNNPNFNTYTIDLRALETDGIDLDLTMIKSLLIEKLATGTGSWQIRKIVFGPPPPPVLFLLDFDGEADGTKIENVTLPNGVTMSLTFDGDGPNGSIQSEAIHMDLSGIVTDEGLTVGGLSIEFSSPIDISESPYLSFEYANAFSSGNSEEGDAFMAVGDASDNGAYGAMPFTLPEFVFNDPDYNTYTIDLRTLETDGIDLDLTMINSILIEKLATGSGSWQIDNIRLGGK